MSRVERSAIVRVSAERMFGLVNDVEAYPRRFAWCEAGAVLHAEAELIVARLELRMAGMRMTFTTRNRLNPGRHIELQLVDGPFTRLAGAWDFLPLAEQACKVSLTLDFELAGRMLGSALASGFRSLADRLVDDFVAAARAEAGS